MSQEIFGVIEAWGRGLVPFVEDESTEYLNWPHSRLINEAWEELNAELQGNGNTPEFSKLWAKHSKRLVTYWLNKARRYVETWQDGKLDLWREVDGEDLRIIPAVDYDDEDFKIMTIERRTTLEHDTVTVSVKVMRGPDGGYSLTLDEFLRPPQIVSEIRLDPEEIENLHYDVIFRKNGISTFQRLQYFEDPENQRPNIKKTEFIDCSALGVKI